MEKIEVIINNDGITAKEVNPYKEQLDKEYRLGHTISFGLLESFRSAESSLRTFEIGAIRDFDFESQNARIGLRAESIQTAEILPNGKIKIL